LSPSRLGFAAAAALLATSALAAGSLRGNGKKTTQPREVPAFTAVRSEGSLDVTVRVGPAPSVSVTVDENLQPEVETVVEDDTLVIRTRGGVSWRGDAGVAVTVPALSACALKGSGNVSVEAEAGAAAGDLALSIHGSGDLRFTGNTATLRAEVDGSGDLTLVGRAEALAVSIRGSGDVKAKQLSALAADVVVDGSGGVETTVAGGALKGRVNGSGDLDWWGTASSVDVLAHGSGEIEHH
jgi:hypothetical protein